MKKVLGLSAVILLLVSACSDENLNKPASEVKLKSTGTDHGYFYQCYVSSGSGSISFPQAGTYAGNFAASWSNVGDIVAAKVGTREAAIEL